MILKRIDKRFKGYPDFRYQVTFLQYKESELYFDIRNWCWEQWGPSMELEVWHKIPHRQNPAWCWVHAEYNMKILFAGEKEYQWFLLKWT